MLQEKESMQEFDEIEQIEQLPVVSINLSGVKYPDNWEEQKSDFQLLPVHEGSPDWDFVESKVNRACQGSSSSFRIIIVIYLLLFFFLFFFS
jgi:hypothetical protein